MEWRGGMVPHIGLSINKENRSSSGDFHRPPLRKIENDWNQFRGPNRDGHTLAQSLPIDWENEPRTRWSMPCGLGHSSIITYGHLVITIEQIGTNETLIARNLEDGTEEWKVIEQTKWHDMLSGTGPRSTPTLHKGKI